MTNIPYLGEGLALLTALTWGCAVILFKKSGETVHPIALNLFKDVLAFLLFIPTMWVFQEQMLPTVSDKVLWRLILSGILGIAIADTLFFYSLQRLGAGRVAIISCLYSPFVITVSYYSLNESLRWLQILGVITIVAAVFLATFRRGEQVITKRNLITGLLFGIMATIATGAGIVLMKPHLSDFSLLWVSEVRLAAGIIVLILLVALHPQRRAIVGSLAIKEGRIYTVWGSFVGAYLSLIPWLGGFKFTQVSIAAGLHQTSSLFVFILASIFLKERITLPKGIGIVLAVSGVYLITFG